MIIKGTTANKKVVGPMKITEYPINEEFSTAIIELDGNHGKIKCLREDRIYFVLEGAGTFILNDEEFIVEKNDVIFVPKNTPYNIIGKMKYLGFCHPAFRVGDDEFLD